MTEASHKAVNLIEDQAGIASGPVTCLGIEFADDAARRAYFTERLREHLQDPAFRAIEGFPIGEDEAILALSDPPYYTACPNPFLHEYLSYIKPLRSSLDLRAVVPFAGDLSASRNNPFVNAHSYATKAPHEIIMRLVLHFTNPGDLILDMFGGTGMTGVAVQKCSNIESLAGLGLTQTSEGSLVDEDGNSYAAAGTRYAIVGDLSPAATFIASNFTLPFDDTKFDEEVASILHDLECNFGRFHKTKHSNGEWGTVIATLWSDAFVCAICGSELSFWSAAVDHVNGKVGDVMKCTNCNGITPKKEMARAWNTKFDYSLGQSIRQFKQVPVAVVYEYGGTRFEKVPDSVDLEIIEETERNPITDWYPSRRMPPGDESRRNDPLGITHIHHFFTKRNLACLARAWAIAQSNRARFMLTSLMYKSSILCAPLMSNYFAEKQGRGGGGWIGKERSGTLYCPSIHSEVSVMSQIRSRRHSTKVTGASVKSSLPLLTTASATMMQLPDESVDYVFTDPPFGSNKMYSELNLLWESWLGVTTDNQPEAIVNRTQRKGVHEYEKLMLRSFCEYFRVLKPGRWITVEFSNTSAAVWNAIQNALGFAGFIVADVRPLDKQQGSILGYTTSTAAKVDLAISAYKPNAATEEEFRLSVGSPEGVWAFVASHLSQLPVVQTKQHILEVVPERLGHTLFDRAVSFHVQRGSSVPLSASEFRRGLAQRFPERNGMYFLATQVAEYDKAQITADIVGQAVLFVSDEKSAITWLRHQLNDMPLPFQDILPRFLRELHQARHEDLPDLRVLLEQNFLQDGAGRYYVPDPANAEDLEKLRLRGLLQEFAQYRQGRKRLKVFRTEAVRAGFAQAYADNDFAAIRAVAALMPESVVQEDPELLMYVDAASLRA